MNNTHQYVIEVNNLSIQFPLSYEMLMTAKSKATSRVRRWLKGNFSRRKIHHFKALDNVSFIADKGEIIGIIGPNGCGKTTLLRAICGIYSPDTGFVKTNGCMSTLLSLGTGFNNSLSGRKNIYLGGYLMGLTKNQIEDQLDSVIEYAELGDHIDVPVKFYSNGMISRLGFSICASMEPEILLIDEVFSVGDLAFKEKSERTMKALLAKAHTQLIVTHNLSYVREKCTRALFIKNGVLCGDGEPNAVVDKYEDWAKNHTPLKTGCRFVPKV